ncbi:MAG: DUF2752 domain-containing protein [Bacteroidales bacterium]|nr:DUF2752 domain-containing protein [Bacteroidales bacterium]
MNTANKKRITYIAIGTVVVCVLLFVYSRFDPTHSVWAPKCPFKMLTGWDCAACGNQRVLYSLLHGDFRAAFLYNPFLCISLPYIIALVTGTLFKRELPRLHRWTTNYYVVITYVVLLCVWWVLRNVVHTEEWI